MKISLSSAEFEQNSNLFHLLFNFPKYVSGEELTPKLYEQEHHLNKIGVPLYSDQIEHLDTWEGYKKEMKLMYNSYAIILTDVNFRKWVHIPFSGGAYLWSIE